MKIAVSSQGDNLNAPISPTFSRCPTFIFVDTETMEFMVVTNPGMSVPREAETQAAQLVTNQGAKAVLTNKIEPKAFFALQAAGIQVFSVKPGTVREAVEAYKAGQLRPLSAPTISQV